MSLSTEEHFDLVKVKDEPPDESDFVVECNPWSIKQEPEEDFSLELPIKEEADEDEEERKQPQKTASKKLVIFPKEYEKQTPFHCRLCGKRFADSELLRSHASVHERTTKCDICGMRVLPKAMNMHVRTVHRADEVFKCPKCYASFKIETNLQQHMKRHDMKFVYRIEK